MKKYFKNKRVLITGHTGFKGSWLSLLMKSMGAKVLGVSNGLVSKPSNFEILKLKDKIISKKVDIKNFDVLKKMINNFKPDFIFHLAAEAIVKKSYDMPRNTWSTNSMGTVNLLEIIRTYKKKTVIVFITSDKVYKNLEINRGYKEADVLGGTDPYSASKSSADIAIQSYISSFLKKKKNIKVGIARAGNVIGGGDWATGRLIPDCIRKWSKKRTVILRNPFSTRPWQHVLDVLRGYIFLAINLKKNKNINGEAFNFGPKIEKNREVIKVVKLMKNHWKEGKWKKSKSKNFFEAKLLHLNSNKSKKYLGWSPLLNLENSIYYTISWYKKFYTDRKNIYNFSLEQINNYLKLKNKVN